MPLSLLFAALVVYASLYPFVGWRWPGAPITNFVGAPLPQYWTGFDVGANLVGYGPLGFLLAVALLRSGWGRWAWPLAVLAAASLSLAVESLQNFLPMRVPSNLDFALNAAGAALGVCFAWILERLGGLRRWSQFRADWFEPQAHGSLVLLALWPFALLYPVSVPFGLGQVWDRLEGGLARLLAETPFLEWVPMRAEPVFPLSPLAEALCVALGLLTPLLMGYGDVRSVWRRLVFSGDAVCGWIGCSCVVRRPDLRPGPRLGLDQWAGHHGHGAGFHRGLGCVVSASPPVPRGAVDGAGCVVELAQPGARERLFRSITRGVGAGAFHPLPRPVPVAGLGVAFRCDGVWSARSGPVVCGAVGTPLKSADG